MKEGDRVKKITGDYRFVGVVVSVFKTLSGSTRVVVENGDGILHIFSLSNLSLDNYPPYLGIPVDGPS